MNRKIKFRLWDNEMNKYFTPEYEAYRGNLYDISISLSGELMARTLNKPAIHESLFPNRYIIEQFTGLLDKNGKEIYEGDIIAFDDCIYIYTVEFKKGKFCLVHTIGSMKGTNWGGIDRVDECDFVMKIIGNIYSNPELLK